MLLMIMPCSCQHFCRTGIVASFACLAHAPTRPRAHTPLAHLKELAPMEELVDHIEASTLLRKNKGSGETSEKRPDLPLDVNTSTSSTIFNDA